MKIPAAKTLKTLFARMNRGILLDICVFVLGIFLLRLLTGNFIELTRVPDEDVWAKVAVALFYTGLLFLSPLGAMLKRKQFWERIKDQDKEKQVIKNVRLFIFSPWISFVWLLIIYAFVVVSWNQLLSPDSFLGSSTIIILAVFFGGMIYCFVGAAVISGFYRSDADAPRWKLHRNGTYADDFFDVRGGVGFDRFDAFLETPLAAALGDLCILLNIIGFQILWSYLFSDLYGEGVKNGEDAYFVSLLYFLLLCLFYFPPRNFYLAEDIRRPIVWLTITLANLPSFLYFFSRVRIF